MQLPPMNLAMIPNADREVVVALAEARFLENPGTEPEVAARTILQEVYGLAPRDGIFTSSPAAIRMGWEDRAGDEDLMDEIVDYVTGRIAPAPAPGM